MTPLKELGAHGQSVWLDYIRRDLVEQGGLADLVAEGVRGVTSNPSIFEKAIGGSTEYDAALDELLASTPTATPLSLFEAVAIEDIRNAADVLRVVYDETDGADGFVSLEVSPELAHDAEGTIRDARRLWAAVDRPNLMIKVPATPEGIPAVEELIASGINVNVTLMFSMAHYEAVAHAYIRGLRRAEDPSQLASVASFFVSRVDTAVDRELDAIGSDDAKRLRGTAAVANSKLAYARYQEIFEGPDFSDLAERGARPQRVLWASTSTKDPAYRDVLYIEELVGDNTVNTVPPQTLDAFRDHGIVRPDAVGEGVDDARAQIAALADLGIDFSAITEKLQVDGVQAFADSFQTMLDVIETKSASLLAETVPSQALHLGRYEDRVAERVVEWAEAGAVGKLWGRDHRLWVDDPEPELVDRLGWLDLPQSMRAQIDDFTWFANEVRAEGFEQVVLLGMGGSSLAPEVFQRTFGASDGYPDLVVLDSTHPEAVKATEERLDLTTTLFVVASKSGTTIEPLSFFSYFWDRLAAVTDTPGQHFVAITDPGSPLVTVAADHSFRKVFTAPPDVGGRYSALTPFGLVPAALLGVDVGALLDRALAMAASARRDPETNPAVALGLAMGELALAGRDKATFVTSPALSALPDWMEQLVAESTGKSGTGILPVAGEHLGAPDRYAHDRFFISLAASWDDLSDLNEALDALEAAGHPVARIVIDDPEAIAAEIFRAEVAVAVAGAVLGINPFNQPDVQTAKALAKQAMAGGLEGGEPPEVVAEDGQSLASAVADVLAGTEARGYVALQAFLAPTPEAVSLLQQIRHAVRDNGLIATTVGFGPRFLHSTGQLHKGGSAGGVFIQIINHYDGSLDVPGEDYTFAELIQGQADGDYGALVGAGRTVLRIRLGDDISGGLTALLDAIDG